MVKTDEDIKTHNYIVEFLRCDLQLDEDRMPPLLNFRNPKITYSTPKKSSLEHLFHTKMHEIGLHWWNSYYCPKSVLSVDMYLPTIKTAIECDGPSHYIINCNGNFSEKQQQSWSYELTGTTKAKKRLLATKTENFDHVFHVHGNLISDSNMDQVV